MTTLEQKIRQAKACMAGVWIPDMPEEVLRLEAQMKSEFANTETIANIIEQNVRLSADVLTVVNSPAVKTKEPPRSIREAIEVLGMRRLYTYVVASALKQMFSGKKVITDILDNSVDVAFCMAELSEVVQGVDRDEAYMLGLFHNVGALLLASKDEAVYERFYLRAAIHPLRVIVEENDQYGSNHSMVGVLVAKQWHLSSDVMKAIMFHHNSRCDDIKNERVRAFVSMLKVANMLVAEVSLAAYQGEEAKTYLHDGISELMLSDDVLRELRLSLMTYAHRPAA